MRFIFFLACRHLLSSKIQSLLIIFAVALGVLVVIFVPAINLGFYAELLNKTIDTSPHISITRYDEINDLMTLKVIDNDWTLNKDKTLLKTRRIQSYQSVMKNIKGIEGITAGTPLIVESGTLINGEKNLNIQYNGIIYPQYQGVVNIDKDLVIGNYNKINPDGIAISQRIADKLRVELNDTVFINTAYAKKAFKIVAIYASGFITRDETTVYIALSAAQNLTGIGNQVDSIGVKVENPWYVDPIAEQLTLKTGLEAATWKDDNEALLSEIASFNYIMFIINFTIMAAIGTGVLGIMIILVNSKHKQIGMLKALGVTSKGVIAIFVVEGLLLSLIGAIIGSILGTGTIAYFNAFPMQISENYGVSSIRGVYDASIYAQAIILAIAAGSLAALIPSYMSSKIDPAEVLKSV